MPNESIFDGEGDQKYVADLQYGTSHEKMTEGYRNGAGRLIKTVEDNAWGVDYMVYPIIFLYRHWLELRLKHIIHVGGQLDHESGGSYKNTHSLEQLWPIAKASMEKVWPNERPAELSKVDAIISDFQTFDPKSQTFRYPVDTSGKSNRKGLTKINVLTFSKRMDEISDFLDDAAMAMSDYLSELRSMQ